jgi:hypothetical protein
MVTTATLVKWVREPCSGEVHLPREEIKVMTVIRYLNLDRTLLRVSWQTGGECLVFPEELEEQSGPVMYFRCGNRRRFQIALCYPAARVEESNERCVTRPGRGSS